MFIRNTTIMKGNELPKYIHDQIYLMAGLLDNEILELVYISSAHYKNGFESMNEIVVGITNRRLFQLEYGTVSQQMLRNISSVTHKRNGWFRWDEIKCVLHSTIDSDKFAIYDGVTCALFCDHLANSIKKNMPLFL